MHFNSTPTNKPQTASFYKDVHFSDDSVVINSVLESSFGKEIRIAFKKEQINERAQNKVSYHGDDASRLNNVYSS